MNDWNAHNVWDVKEILDSGDPDRMDTEAQGWRDVESTLEGVEARLKARIETLGQHVSGGAFQVLTEEQGNLTMHVTDLRFNAQSNGVGWKGLADTLREARPKIDQVATSYTNTVVDADGLISASDMKQDGAKNSADAEAQRIMTHADDSFQQVYANTSSEPPPYQGPGESGQAYQPGGGNKAGPGVYVDPGTGKYTGPATNPYSPGTGTTSPVTGTDGPRTEFPIPPGAGGPGAPGGTGVFPGGGTPGGPGGGGPYGTGPYGTGPFGSGPGTAAGPGGPGGPAGLPGFGPYGGGPGAASARPGAPGRPGMGMPMGGGAHGGAGAGRPGVRGTGPGGKPLPGGSPKSVYRDRNGGAMGAGTGAHGRRDRRREDEASYGNGPYDDELFQVDGRYTEDTLRPEAPVRVRPGPYLGSGDIRRAEPVGADLVVPAKDDAALVLPPAPKPRTEPVVPTVEPPRPVKSTVDVVPDSLVRPAERGSGAVRADEAGAGADADPEPVSKPMNIVDIMKAVESMPPAEARRLLAAEAGKRAAG